MSGLANRRHQRRRFLARTRRVMREVWHLAPETVDRLAVRWCQNRRKCSCFICSTQGLSARDLRAPISMEWEW